MLKKLKPYAIFIALSLGTGIGAAILTMGNMDIYEMINTPPLSPPSILFPIVWTALYILMGISAAMVYERRGDEPKAVRDAIYIFLASLAVNFSWSIIFFNFREYLIALLWVIFLLFLVIRTIFAYKRVSPAAAYIQIPYAVWCAFAAYLALGVYILN